MFVKEISIKEYSELLQKVSRYDFLCSAEYLRIKSEDSKIKILAGYVEDEPVIMAPIVYLPWKKIFKFAQIYYGPLFLKDYDVNLLKKFLVNIKKYISKDFMTIALQVSSPIVKEFYNGFEKICDNSKAKEAIEAFEKTGYRHIPYTFYDDEARKYAVMLDSVYVKKIECEEFDEVFKTFNTAKIDKKLIEDYGIKVKELDSNGYDVLKNFVEDTYDKKDVLHRGYANWYAKGKKYFGKNMKFVVSYIDKSTNLDAMIKKNTDIIHDNMTQMQYSEQILKDDPDNKKQKRKIEQARDQINGANKRIASFEEIKQRLEKENEIILTASLFIKVENELFFVSSGRDYDISKNIKANIIYPVHEYMFKYAIENGIKYYNFYGTSPEFSKKSKDYGVQVSKSIFRGDIVTYLGSFYLKNNFLADFLMKNYKNI